MTKIVVISTGGTIAMRRESASDGAVPTLLASDLISGLDRPGLTLEADQLCNIPSSHMTPELLWSLRDRVVERLAEPDTIGAIIPHGTDTMEETAYLLDLTVPSSKPVVLTGAMRTASDAGYDGQANLATAVATAISSEAVGMGTLLAFNDKVHAARYVTKVHTQSPDAFASPGFGPLGHVVGGLLALNARVDQDLVGSPGGMEPDVHLLRLAMGAPGDVLTWLVGRGARGVVIEALGGGRVPPWWMDPIHAAIESGMVVVIATRTLAGPPYDRYGYPGAYRDLRAAGVRFSGMLNGQKARIRLMLALAMDKPARAVDALFPTPPL
jgi:L-asparaginase